MDNLVLKTLPKPETMCALADCLVELRGFEPMAIAGAGEISGYSSLTRSMRAARSRPVPSH
jgi:hypothetical protein